LKKEKCREKEQIYERACPTSVYVMQMGYLIKGEIGSLVLWFKWFQIAVVVVCFRLFAL
jgi:hypothetical protein